MLRKLLLFTLVIGLLLSLATPALAEDGKGKGKGEGWPGPFKARAFQGTITAIEDSVWTVNTQAHGDIKVDVSGAKVHWPGKKDARISDFKVNDRVAVKLAAKPGDTQPYKAAAVSYIPPKRIVHVTGTVTSINKDATPKTITIKVGNQEQTYNLSSDVKVASGTQSKSLDDVKLNQKVTLIVWNLDKTVMAIVIHQQP